MLSVHQLWLLLAVDAAVAIAGTLVVAHLVDFPGRDGGGDGAAGRKGVNDENDGLDVTGAGGAWHEEAGALAREVRQTASTLDRSTDPDRVSRRLLPLSTRIRGHVRSAPPAVDADVYRRLFELGMACQRVAIEGRPVDGPGGYGRLEDRLNVLRSEADDLQWRVASAG